MLPRCCCALFVCVICLCLWSDLTFVLASVINHQHSKDCNQCNTPLSHVSHTHKHADLLSELYQTSSRDQAFLVKVATPPNSPWRRSLPGRALEDHAYINLDRKMEGIVNSSFEYFFPGSCYETVVEELNFRNG